MKVSLARTTSQLVNETHRYGKTIAVVYKHTKKLWDRADVDTTFASLKNVYRNPKLNLRVRRI